jgi:hypothetical protein
MLGGRVSRATGMKGAHSVPVFQQSSMDLEVC